MKQDLTRIISRCFVNIPFAEFDKYEKVVLRNRINPEIGLDGETLYTFKEKDFINRARFLQNEGLHCTLHAPFQDMLPGAVDKHVLQAVRDKLQLCFDLSEIFRPSSIVCHLGYLDCIHSYDQKQWLATSLETWQKLLPLAEASSTHVMFENTYEKGPRIHKLILEALNSPQALFCLDVGHLMAFANVVWQEWLATLGPWLGQLHLHDNHGYRDEHLPVGSGDFDFPGFFSALKSRNIQPIITLEPRSESGLWESLNALDRLAIFDHK